MKLTKVRLVKLTRVQLSKLGYQEMKDSVTGANGLFVRSLGDGFYLSLGFVISNYYESKFTAAYYLSQSTRWSSWWNDIPVESYRRPGDFLEKEYFAPRF